MLEEQGIALDRGGSVSVIKGQGGRHQEVGLRQGRLHRVGLQATGARQHEQDVCDLRFPNEGGWGGKGKRSSGQRLRCKVAQAELVRLQEEMTRLYRAVTLRLQKEGGNKPNFSFSSSLVLSRRGGPLPALKSPNEKN